jgi:hypothetical protein
MQWKLVDPGKQAPFTQQTFKIYRLGYCWWRYGEYCGELLYVRFAKQNFFKPDKNVTDFQWQMAPGVRGDWHGVATKLDELPVEVINKGISLAAGKLAGLGKIGVLESTGNVTIGPPPEVKRVASNKRLLK